MNSLINPFPLPTIPIHNNFFSIDSNHSYLINQQISQGTQGSIFSLTHIQNPSHKLILKKIPSLTSSFNYHHSSDTQILISHIASHLHISPTLHFSFLSQEKELSSNITYYNLIMDFIDLNLHDFIYSYELSFNPSHDKSTHDIKHFLKSILKTFNIPSQLQNIHLKCITQGLFLKNDNLLNNFLIDSTSHIIYGIDFDRSYFHNNHISSYELNHHNYLFYELQTTDDDSTLRIPLHLDSLTPIQKLL